MTTPSRLCFAAALWLAGCDPAPPVDHAARRAALRDELRAVLAAGGPGVPDPAALAQELAAAPPARRAAGAEIYAKSCAKCHGGALDGKGPRAGGLDPRPAPLVGPGSDFYTPAEAYLVIARGAPGTAMAPWSRAFTDQQIRDVLAHLLAERAAAAAGGAGGAGR